MGCDARNPHCLCQVRSFNPRTHMGCDTSDLPAPVGKISFNPRTHMGCDSTTRYNFETLSVSIHAPTWGATFNGVLPKAQYGVSIHAPTWGATQKAAEIQASINEFQSTHPHGVRHPCLILVIVKMCFNPRTHMGCDPCDSKFSGQSQSFNPRTHMGCD